MITLKQDIEEDLYDGQVLQKLIEKLSGEKLSVPGIYTHLLIVESILNYFQGLPLGCWFNMCIKEL